MLVFIAGLMATFTFAVGLSRIITHIENVSTGQPAWFQGVLSSANGVLWALITVLVLLLAARAANALQDRFGSSDSEQ